MKRLAWPKNQWPKGTAYGIDTEYGPDGTILDVAIGDTRSAYRIAPTDKKSLARAFKIPTCIGHVIGGDLTALIRLGCTREDWAKGVNIYDSFIIARLADENRGKGGYTVDALLASRHTVKDWKNKTNEISKTDATLWPPILRAERCRLDAWSCLHVAEDWWEDAQGPIELQTAIACTLERVRLTGAYVDMPAYDKWTKAVKSAHTRSKDTLTKLAWSKGMKEFSPTKPNDIRELFYKRCKIPVEEKTPKGLPAVTKAFLSRHRDDYPVVAKTLEFRKIDKLLTTYVKGLKNKIVMEPAPHIPFRLGAMATRTGRRASEKPNAQNWPKSARAIICSRWKNGMILDNDFSKLEIILLAYEAQDEELMRYFTEEKNGYIAIATKLFSKTVEEGTADYRQVKAVILGVNYNLQTYGLAHQLWDLHHVRLSTNYERHVELVDEVRNKYLRMFPRIVAYQRDRVRELHDHHSAMCWLGHIRRLPIPPEPPRSEYQEWKKWRRHVAHLENEAINARIQNAASYVCGTAMLDCESALLEHVGYSYIHYHKTLAQGRSMELSMALLINEVHDDLVYDCPKKEVKHAQHIIKECMTKLTTLRKLMPEFDAPVRVSQSASSHWGKVE